MTKAQELDTVFDNLSDEAKIQFLLKLQYKEDIPKAFSLKAMDFLKKKEEKYQATAAIFAEKAGKIQEAIEIHKKRGYLDTAGKVAERNNHPEEAHELYKQYIESRKKEIGSESDIKVKESRISVLISFARDKGFFKTAIELYEELGNISEYHADHYYMRGGDIAEKHGFEEEVFRLYTRASIVYENRAERFSDYHNGFHMAIYYAEKAGNDERVLELHRKVIRKLKNNEFGSSFREEPINYAEKNGLIDDAVDLCEEKQLFERGGDVARKHDREDKARELYSKAIDICELEGNFEHALKIAKKSGLEEKVRILGLAKEVLA